MTAARPSRLAVALFVLALAVQVYSVYAPDSPAQPTFANEDKIAHALLFGMPVAIAWATGLRPRLVTGIIALHAPVSELVQHYVLPHRSGDVWDAVADLVGVLLGLLAGRAIARLVSRSSSRW
ncbi:MAG: VanZ family protein [Nostocoides sp.]